MVDHGRAKGGKRVSQSDSLSATSPEGFSATAGSTNATDDAWADYDDSKNEGWRSITTENDEVPGISPEPPSAKLTTETAAKRMAWARLVPIEDAAGEELPLFKPEVVVGRSARNEVVIDHPSVSREHARILHTADRFWVIDNRSANGVFVNRERVDRARLHSGDEIAFGNATYRFLERDDVYQAVAAVPEAVAPATVFSARGHRGRPPLTRRAYLVSALLLLLAGTAGVAAQWFERQGANAWPGGALVVGLLPTPRAPEMPPPPSWLAPEAVSPGSEVPPPASKGAPSDHRRAKPAQVSRPQKPSMPPRSRSLRSDQPARRLFASGDVAGALAWLADHAGPRRAASMVLASRIERFAQHRDAAMDAYRVKRAKGALALFEQARQIAVALVGERAQVVRELDGKMADMLYVRGIEAWNRKDFGQALHQFVEARQRDPLHEKSQEKIRALAERAQALYAEATAAPLGSQTKERLRQILEIVPAGSLLFRRVQERLTAMK